MAAKTNHSNQNLKEKDRSHPKDYYIVPPLPKLISKSYNMEKRLKSNPELTFYEVYKAKQYHSSIFERYFLANQPLT